MGQHLRGRAEVNAERNCSGAKKGGLSEGSRGGALGEGNECERRSGEEDKRPRPLGADEKSLIAREITCVWTPDLA